MMRRAVLLLAFALLSAVAADVASGQTVLVRALHLGTSEPVVGALAHLMDGAGDPVRSSLTDDRGRALFLGISAGSYRVRVEMIGMATAETELLDVSRGATLTPLVRLERRAIELEGLNVALASGRCTVRPGDEGALVARMWDEARKALSVASLAEERSYFRYETIRYERQLDRDTGVVLSEERDRQDRYLETPYKSYPATDLVENGFVQDDGLNDVYMAPDATVLLSDAFLDTHCFHLADGGDGPGDPVGLGFRPTGEDRSVPDIAGTMWIDPASAELRWLEFTYRHLEPERTTSQVGGRVDFERLDDGRVIVREWWIRMPIMGRQTDVTGRSRQFIARYHQTGGIVVAARAAGGRRLSGSAGTGGVEGVVRDSVGVPVQGARVQVVGSNQAVYSNAQGRFGITGLPEGRYQVEVRGTGLEPAGFTSVPVTRDVIPGEMSSVEFHLPSMADLLFDQCRGEPRQEGAAALAGIVYDATGLPVPEANVRVVWRRYDFSGVLQGRRPSDLRGSGETLERTTDSLGRFRFCDVPVEVPLELSASASDTASGEIELMIPEYEIGAVRTLVLQGGAGGKP